MNNLEFLKYLEDEGILSIANITVEPGGVALVYDMDGWNNTLIYFDDKGNVIIK